MQIDWGVIFYGGTDRIFYAVLVAHAVAEPVTTTTSKDENHPPTLITP